MSQQYSLKWNNHQPNFISTFTTLLSTQTLVDVTLAAEGKHLRAHKIVLSACSTYFQSVLVENPSQHPIVILKDVSFANLRILVDFMYYGEVNVTEGQLSQVLETAKMLKIKGLTDMPEPTPASLTRTTGTCIDYQETGDNVSDSGRQTPQLAARRKRRKTSSGSGHMNLNVIEERAEAVHHETITLSRRRDIDDRIETGQMRESENVETINIDENQLSHEGGQWSVEAFPRYGAGGSGMQEGMFMCGGMGEVYGVGEGGGNGGVGEAGVSGGGGSGSLQSQGDHVGHTAAPPARRRRATNPQQQLHFQKALEAVRFGGIGFCKAAKMYGVNNRTLWLEYRKLGYPTMRQSIRNRIKRETSTPPLPNKEDANNSNALNTINSNAINTNAIHANAINTNAIDANALHANAINANAAMIRTQPDQVALLQQNMVPVSYMEARQIDFPTFAQSTINNILGVNFNPNPNSHPHPPPQ